MKRDSQTNDVEMWRRKLGLLPVPLFDQENSDNKFVLLNGSRGNFCLDFTQEDVGHEKRNRAWSSDVGHYVSLIGRQKYVEVQSWNWRPSLIQRYSYESVIRDLEGFHAYLMKDEQKSSVSAVAHVIRIFRSIRGALENQADGAAALKAFLYLLACSAENVSRNKLPLKKWGVDAEARNVADLIPVDEWNALIEELTTERLIDSLTLNIDLMLRHASGRVFQETHHEAIFKRNPQRSLFGMSLPDPVHIEKQNQGVGVHFTPPALARTLVEEAISASEKLTRPAISIFDPACGSGEFLREALRQLILKGYKGKIKLEGWDVSSAACDMTRFALAREMQGLGERVIAHIRCANSLSDGEAWPLEVDFILMNPPFVSWKDMDEQQRASIKAVLGRLFQEQPDMSTAFLWKAASCLTNNGVLGSILPASFLNGTATAKLRGALGEVVKTKLVARLGSHLLFPNALIDAGLYLGVKNQSTRGEAPVAFWADYRTTSTADGLRALRMLRYNSEDVLLPVVKNGFSVYRNPDLGHGSDNWSPRPYESWTLLHSLNHPPVEDLFNVVEGGATGHNKTFLIKKEDLLKLPKGERQYFRPAVVNKSITGGFLSDSTYVFYPYGDYAIDTENQLQKVVSTYYNNVLKKNKSVLLERTRINKDKWWNLRLHLPWQVTPTPKLVSTHFGDAGSFAWDDNGNFVVLQGHAWLFKGTEGFPSLPANVGLAYLAILNSPIFSELLSAACNHVGGGQWDLSKRFVSKIPLPNLMSEELSPDTLEELTKFGKKMHSGLDFDEKKLEVLVTTIYSSGQLV